MARYDQIKNNVRATAGTPLHGLLAVSVNAGGSLVPAGSAAAQGVVCIPGTILAGKPTSFLLDGEIVEFDGAPGTDYYAVGTAGSIGTAVGGVKVGYTIEGSRLVVRM